MQHKTVIPFEPSAQSQSQCLSEYGASNRFSAQSDSYPIQANNKYPIHSSDGHFGQPNGLSNHSISHHNHISDIVVKNSNTSNHKLFNEQLSEDQDLVIDLTTNHDHSSRNGLKRVSEDPDSRDSDSDSLSKSSERLLRDKIGSNANDFCCQVNTAEDTEDIDVDVDVDVEGDSDHKQ